MIDNSRLSIHGNIFVYYVRYVRTHGWHAWMRTLTHLVLFYFMESLRVVVSLVILWKRRYQIQCERRVFGITVIRYAQNRKNGKLNNLALWAQTSKISNDPQDKWTTDPFEITYLYSLVSGRSRISYFHIFWVHPRFLVGFVLLLLRYTDSDYPFGIFKLFF